MILCHTRKLSGEAKSLEGAFARPGRNALLSAIAARLPMLLEGCGWLSKLWSLFGSLF